jgi:hypothetical protein
MDHYDLGSAPANERCAQLGIDADYPVRARRECHALINQCLRTLGIPPLRARFRTMSSTPKTSIRRPRPRLEVFLFPIAHQLTQLDAERVALYVFDRSSIGETWVAPPS